MYLEMLEICMCCATHLLLLGKLGLGVYNHLLCIKPERKDTVNGYSESGHSGLILDIREETLSL